MATEFDDDEDAEFGGFEVFININIFIDIFSRSGCCQHIFSVLWITDVSFSGCFVRWNKCVGM